MKGLAPLLLLAASHAYAGGYTGNEILSWPRVQFLAYVSGFLDGEEAGLGLAGETSMSKTQHCIPTGVTYAQTADVIEKWLRDNPDKRHIYANVLISVALRQAWPCAKQ